MTGLFVEGSSFTALYLCLYIAALIADSEKPLRRRRPGPTRSLLTGAYRGGHRAA